MSGEGFLSRWSRRKRAVEAGRPAEEPPVAGPAEVRAPEGPAPAVAPADPQPEFDVSSLPPIESLTLESDITAFLRKEVPEVLKRAALRKAWSLDPAIRDFVGPAEYAWDFNAPDGVPGFSLDIGGDARQLLAQAMGFDDRPPGGGQEPQGPPPPSQDTVAEPAVPSADTDAAPAKEPPVTLAEGPPADPAPRADQARAEAPARRHGSATPS